jgi:hypothetical protein
MTPQLLFFDRRFPNAAKHDERTRTALMTRANVLRIGANDWRRRMATDAMWGTGVLVLTQCFYLSAIKTENASAA